VILKHAKKVIDAELKPYWEAGQERFAQDSSREAEGQSGDDRSGSSRRRSIGYWERYENSE